MKTNSYTLTNANGLRLRFSDFGGVVQSLTVPDRNGKMADILLAVDDPVRNSGYFGALIGRVGNRIALGRLDIDGRRFTLDSNEVRDGQPCCLHGGKKGYDRRPWQVRKFKGPDGPAAELTLFSPDGDGGFPGNVAIRVVYTLTDANVWRIEYWAVTDAPTALNLTNHAYFNLAGCRGDVLGHVLQLFADRYTPAGPDFIYDGRVLPVKGTPFDFSKPTAIGARIGDQALAAQFGYDHNYVVRRKASEKSALVKFAVVSEPKSGREMECWTTQPCFQFYSGNFIDEHGPVAGKRGVLYRARHGFCLETQGCSGSLAHPSLPGNCVLRPGEVYHHVTEYRFSAK